MGRLSTPSLVQTGAIARWWSFAPPIDVNSVLVAARTTANRFQIMVALYVHGNTSLSIYLPITTWSASSITWRMQIHLGSCISLYILTDKLNATTLQALIYDFTRWSCSLDRGGAPASTIIVHIRKITKYNHVIALLFVDRMYDVIEWTWNKYE